MHLLRVESTLHDPAVHHLHLLSHSLSCLWISHADLIDHLHHMRRVHHLLLHGNLLRGEALLPHTSGSSWEHRSYLLLRLLNPHTRWHVRSHPEHLPRSLRISLHHLSLLHIHCALHGRVRKASHLSGHTLYLIRLNNVAYHSWAHLRPHLNHPWHHLLSELHGDWLSSHRPHSHRGLASNFVDSWNLRWLLPGLSTDVVIVLLHVILNLVEVSIPQRHCCLRIHKRYLVNEVLLHVLIPVLNEHISRNFLLYKSKGKLNNSVRR